MQTLASEIVGYMAVSAFLGLVLGYLIFGFRRRTDRPAQRPDPALRRTHDHLEEQVTILRREIVGLHAEREAALAARDHARAEAERSPTATTPSEPDPPPAPVPEPGSLPRTEPGPQPELMPTPGPVKAPASRLAPASGASASGGGPDSTPGTASESEPVSHPAPEHRSAPDRPRRTDPETSRAEPENHAPDMEAEPIAIPAQEGTRATTDGPAASANYDPATQAGTDRADLDSYTDEDGPARLKEAVEVLQEELQGEPEKRLSLLRIRGIGKATASRLNDAGIEDVARLAALSDDELRSLARRLDLPHDRVAEWQRRAHEI